jgi:hypothetical protein
MKFSSKQYIVLYSLKQRRIQRFISIVCPVWRRQEFGKQYHSSWSSSYQLNDCRRAAPAAHAFFLL